MREQVYCNQDNCDALADDLVYWPGRAPLPMCRLHSRKADGISAAMGFALHTEPMAGKE